MVTQHFRWDFVGLSTDTKPTPETSEKVVDGSTFYCSDTSKLYVFCKDDWYERKPLGEGGGTTYTAGDNITISDGVISATDTTYSPFTGTDGEEAGTSGLVPAPATTDAGKFLKADGTWGTAGGGDTIRELTSADYNYPVNNPNKIALWLMPTGRYIIKAGTSSQYALGWTLPGANVRDIYCEIYKDATTTMSFIKFVYTIDTPTRFVEFIVSPNGDIQEVNNYGGGLVYATYNALNAGNNQDGKLTPLSAYQGKVLKDLIDALTTRVTALEGN